MASQQIELGRGERRNGDSHVSMVLVGGKRPRGRPRIHPPKDPKEPKRSPGRPIGSRRPPYTAMLPRVIILAPGEDVATRIFIVSQEESKAICVLSANGAVSSVTLREPGSPAGSATYEGRFELLSLTGSFLPDDSSNSQSRMGGLSVCLAGDNGTVFGGGVAGHLLAASPVQVVVGIFPYEVGESLSPQSPSEGEQPLALVSRK